MVSFLVYVSSTFNDLQPCRMIVYQTLRQLGYDAIAMEDYVAADVRPLQRCLDDVRSCDLYVGILGFRFGHMPDNSDARSITWWEFDEAGRHQIPRLVFLMSPAAAIGHAQKDDTLERIVAFRDHVAKETLVSFFESPLQLGLLMTIALRKWEVENG